jgi:hypothetical protein
LGKRYGDSSLRSKLPFVIGLGLPFLIAWRYDGDKVSIPFPPAVMTTCAVLMLTTIALVMFYVKLHALRTYAILELLFALGVLVQAVQTIKTNETDAAHTLTLVGGVYLLIRGMDNFNKDRETREARL